MTVFFILLICIPAVFSEPMGKTLSLTKQSSRCGDWQPYKDEKCLKIATHAGHQTKEDAEVVCQAFSEGLNQAPHLITVKTQEEHEFLHHFLFIESNIVDNVWLGLQVKRNSGELEWSDGTDVRYSNWANQNITDDRHQCVQMASGEELAEAGLWVKVNCRKGGIVVCERTQTWSLETLQNMFLNYKLEQEQLVNEKERKLKEEIDNLKRNPVPIGFIYIQLPSQQPPSILWPLTKWTDVSSSYANLFFRVVGGKAEPFGTIQEESTSRLAQVQYVAGVPHESDIKVPPDGSWSQYIYTGGNDGLKLFMRFRVSGEEVRPRNQAVKVWQRSQ